jgi:hypothetical protein
MVLANRALALGRLGDADEARRSLEESRNMPVRSVIPLLRRRQLHAESAVLIAERRLEDARRLLTVFVAEGSAERDSPLVRDAEFLLNRIADPAGGGQPEAPVRRTETL